jgi:hypothetical protein
MANVIQVPTYEQIEVLLSKLATNYSNLASVFYDIFYNTTPMDVTFQMYNKEGVLQTYTIPNRAQDMKSMLSGNGTPEGSIEAAAGVTYQDLQNGDLYVKKTADGNEGWEQVATDDYLGTFLRQGNGSPEGNIIASRGVLYVDLINSTLYIKSTPTGSIGWTLISASTAVLEKLANKKDVINSSSTDVDYPSAKAVYTFVNNLVGELANKNLSNLTSEGQAILDSKANRDLSNLSDTGEKHFAHASLDNLTDAGELKFIDWSRVRDCVLATANTSGGYDGVAKKDGDKGVEIPAGMTVLFAQGLTEYGKFNYSWYQISAVMSGTSVGINNEKCYIIFSVEYGVNICPESQFIVSDSEPEISIYNNNAVWYNPKKNQYSHKVAPEGLDPYWNPVPTACVGELTTTDTDVPANIGTIDTFTPYYPVELVSTKDIQHTVIETGSSADASNWYKLYRDGWLEQGGYFTGTGPIQFLKEFNATHYTFVPSANVTSFTKESDQVTVTVTSSSVETNWIASGWAAS